MNNPGDILEAMAFKSMSVKQLTENIVAKLMKPRQPDSWQYRAIPESRVRAHVDMLAQRYGNLGTTRRKLIQCVLKEIRRIESKAARKRWADYYKRHDGPPPLRPRR